MPSQQLSSAVFDTTMVTWCGRQLPALETQRLANQQDIRHWIETATPTNNKNREDVGKACPRAAKQRLMALERFFKTLKN